jgi:hypothetical protein
MVLPGHLVLRRFWRTASTILRLTRWRTDAVVILVLLTIWTFVGAWSYLRITEIQVTDSASWSCFAGIGRGQVCLSYCSGAVDEDLKDFIRFTRPFLWSHTFLWLADSPFLFTTVQSPRVRYRIACFPHWLVALILFVRPAIPISYGIRRYLWLKHGRCVCCGYDLRGSKGRCPECGTDELTIDVEKGARLLGTRFWRTALLSAGVCVIIAVFTCAWIGFENIEFH